MHDSYCPICGNTGIDINNNICKCRLNIEAPLDDVTCLDVPAQYIGTAFSSLLVPSDLGDVYCKKLQSIHDAIIMQKLRYHNIILCSPARHSKTILAYSCIQNLFRNNIPVFPLMDIMEIQRIVSDIDYCRMSIFDIPEPERMYTVPYLFVKVPPAVTYDTYNNMSMLLERRVRRGGSTIFLYNGTWGNLTSIDKRGTLKYLQGDGSGSSMEVSSWYKEDAGE